MPATEKPEALRLFFALWPSDAVRNRLAEWRSYYMSGSGRPVPDQNLHVTLVFLGEQPVERRPVLEAAADRVTVDPFTLRIDCVNHWRRTRLLWAGPSVVPDALMALVRQLREAVQAAGVAVENRPYRPHVSLVRNTTFHAPRGPRRWPSEAIVWPVEGFSLVQSTLSHAGPRYRVLRSWPLGGCH